MVSQVMILVGKKIRSWWTQLFLKLVIGEILGHLEGAGPQPLLGSQMMTKFIIWVLPGEVYGKRRTQVLAGKIFQMDFLILAQSVR